MKTGSLVSVSALAVLLTAGCANKVVLDLNEKRLTRGGRDLRVEDMATLAQEIDYGEVVLVTKTEGRTEKSDLKGKVEDLGSTGLSLLSTLLYGETRPDSAPNLATNVVVQWSAPTNGLAIGLEVPRSPLVFTTGPRGSHPNLVVHLRNTCTNELLWSEYDGVWGIHFTGVTFGLPSRLSPPFSTGLVTRVEPHRQLPPGGEAIVSIPMWRLTGFRWPAVPDGIYRVAVTYSCPGSWAGMSQTYRGKTWRPFQEPGLWRGRVSTPAVLVAAKLVESE